MTFNNHLLYDYVDFWYYKIGVNVIPADTKNKIPLVSWSLYQNQSLPQEVLEIWKKERKFDKGIAVILGKVWRGEFENYFLIGIDCDNKKAVDEICSYKNKKITTKQLANKTLVECHMDDLNRIHIYFYSSHPFVKKSSDIVSKEIKEKIQNNEIPAIEVKGSGEHGILFCSPSLHRNGFPYKIVGINKPMICDDMEIHIDNIFKKHGIRYLEHEINKNGQNIISLSSKIPIQDLFNPDFVILQGHNRHEGILRAMESLLKRNYKILRLNDIKNICQLWNQRHCEPPLNDKEFERQWNCAIKFIDIKTRKIDQENDSDSKNRLNNQDCQERDKNPLILSVSEALRTNSGHIKVEGMITSRTNIFKMKNEIILSCNNCGYSDKRLLDNPIFDYSNKEDCPSCKKEKKLIESESNYLNAITIELQDTETFNEIERLQVILFEEDTKNINLGERVIITGVIQITTFESKNKKPHSILYAKSVEYESKEEIIITSKDREAIEKFTRLKIGENNIIDILVSMFDITTIGHDNIKKGLLIAAVNSGIDNNYNKKNFVSNSNSIGINHKKRQRINVLIIGDPGLAKSKLLKRIVQLVPNSKYESAQNSSGKSLTAIVSKEGESFVLRLGPVPLAKGAICSLNEFSRMAFEDQGHLLDVMEEGEFTINKHGINAKILSPTTIISSSNPINNSKWIDSEKISIDEIPALKPIIDRYDLIFVVRTIRDEYNIRKYTYEKADQEDRKIPDYSVYLKKHILYAKRFNPKLSEEAKSMINEYHINMRGKNSFGSNRILDTLFRVSKAIAKLKLKNIVDENDAKETMEFYNVILQQIENVVNIPDNPRDIAYEECISVLKEIGPNAISMEELFKKGCERNKQVQSYFGINKSLKIQSNSKTRAVYEMLRNHSKVRIIGEKPIVFQWLL